MKRLSHIVVVCEACGTEFHPWNKGNRPARFCSVVCLHIGHHPTSTNGAPAIERLVSKISFEGKCWVWTAAKNRRGYGKIQIDGKSVSAHRAAFLLFYGYLPEPPLVLDHICRNRACVRPSHLRPCTVRENTLWGVSFAAINAVKTECLRGHPFDEANTYVLKRQRFCRQCGIEHQLDRRARERQARGSAA